MLIAIDIGTTYGYTVDGQNCFSGQLSKTDVKFYEFFMVLQNLHNVYGLTNIVYEAAGFQSGYAIPVYHGLVGVLKCFADALAIPITGIPVGTIKKSFTNNGRADKIEIMNKCKELKLSFTDNNAADALAVWHTYNKLYGK